jgi:hypothetical protein
MHRADAATVSYTEIVVQRPNALLRYQPCSPCQPTRPLCSYPGIHSFMAAGHDTDRHAKAQAPHFLSSE